MGVSKNRGVKPPKSFILIVFSIIFTIHFGGFFILGNTHVVMRSNVMGILATPPQSYPPQK